MTLHKTHLTSRSRASRPALSRKAAFLRLAAALLLVALLMTSAGCSLFPLEAAPADPADNAAYTLDRMVILSRHNTRSPMSGSGSLLDEITPHTWFDWTSEPSELSVRGGEQHGM